MFQWLASRYVAFYSISMCFFFSFILDSFMRRKFLIWLHFILGIVPIQVDYYTTESVVSVDWENGFVEASAKVNENVNKVF